MQLDDLVDQFGRRAQDLRISVTDRCNLRCVYCMPEKQAGWLARKDYLGAQHIYRLVNVGLQLGIRDVRFTGGEPLLRPDLAKLISAAAKAFDEAGRPRRIALTTNAIGLERRLPELTDAGLQRINVSIDTLRPDRFALLTRRARFDDLLRGLEAVEQSALSPIKINTVAVDYETLTEVGELVRFCLQRGWQWRAIELMPIGPMRSAVAPTGAEILETLRSEFELVPRVGDDPHAPATTYTVAAGADHPAGVVGVIASMSEPFCTSCSRTRISAVGRVYPCLFSPLHIELREALESGTDEEIARLWQGVTRRKPAGHAWLPPVEAGMAMSKIGG
ncbi:MAG: GTP 3',8-cyclase MoaA [Actinomycetaceae bacterium]|nr:GTP 3',8-cyclase MoaA [Actinomycetaceae bacterium]